MARPNEGRPRRRISLFGEAGAVAQDLRRLRRAEGCGGAGARGLHAEAQREGVGAAAVGAGHPALAGAHPQSQGFWGRGGLVFGGVMGWGMGGGGIRGGSVRGG